MHLAHLTTHAGRDPRTPFQLVPAVSQRAQLAPDSPTLILRHTLLIISARTEDQLLARTLAAACDITGAVAAAAIGPDGVRRSHGRPELAAGDFSSTLTARLGETVIIIAVAEGSDFDPDAGPLLTLLVAHAQAGQDHLDEVAALSRRADRDPLTGLRHAGPFAERLGVVSPDHTAVILVDLDEFKKINDVYGHQAGDEALLCLVGALRAGLRGDDRLFRIGGDEFAVVIDVNGAPEALAVARRLLSAARRIGHSISIGAALHVPGETGQETLARADRALYAAKRSGRNTIRLAH